MLTKVTFIGNIFSYEQTHSDASEDYLYILFELHIGSFAKGFVCLKIYRLSLNAPLPLRQFDKFELFPVWGNLCSYSLSASLNINGNQLLAEKTGNVLQRKCCKIMMRESLKTILIFNSSQGYWRIDIHEIFLRKKRNILDQTVPDFVNEVIKN